MSARSRSEAAGRLLLPAALLAVAVAAVWAGWRRPALEGAQVAVCQEECVESIADGLFGLDLQAAFDVRLDLRGGVLRFADCEEVRVPARGW